MDFTNRSSQKELLDEDSIPALDLYQNLKELAFINNTLGGFAISVAGVSKLITDSKRRCHIVDIGCGGGDNLIAIAKWGNKKGIELKLTGIDLKKEAVTYAKKNCSAYSNIHFVESDYLLSTLSEPADIIVSSLFCHHLNESQFDSCLKWMQENARIGFVINDLHRNKIAYYSIKWLTALFSKSYLVKNDAAVSVSRGFVRSELEAHLKKAQLNNYSIQWKWAFRYLVIGRK